MPPARVYFFQFSCLAKDILFAKFSPFSLGKGMLFWKFRSEKCQTSVIPVKKPNFLITLVHGMQKFIKFSLENTPRHFLSIN